VSTLTIILAAAGVMFGAGVLAIIAWFGYTTYLNWIERRLARRKGVYRQLVGELATREHALLEPEIRRIGTLRDLEALEAVLEEQARATAERPGWLLDVYDRLGLVDRYVEKLKTARRWRERAFAAELLGRVGNARAVPVLLEIVQATRTEDGDVREIALRALARIADPRAVGPLVESLKTAEPWLAPRIADILTRHGLLVVDPLIALLEQPGSRPARAWAANVLGEVRAQPAFPVLARGLVDPDDELRAKSASALGRLGDPRAIAPLLGRLLTDPAPFVRARIATALGRFDDPEVIDRLVRGLGDPAWWVRMRSVEALEQIGPRAEGPLLVALDDPDPEIRTRAAGGLERLGVPTTLVDAIRRGERSPEATETLVKFAAAGARGLLTELLLHPSPEVRLAVVTAIRRATRHDFVSELIEVARADADSAVRAAAIGALGALGGPGAVEHLRQRTADPDGRVRAAAARALGLLRASQAMPDFLRLIGDPQPDVREAAARGLGRLRDPSAVPALVHAFEGADSATRSAILEAVVSRLDGRTVGRLVDVLLDSHDMAGKLGAVRTLGRLRSSAAAPALERLRRDPAPLVRAGAIEAFGRVGGDTTRAAIATALHDSDEAVRIAALVAAGRLQLEDQSGSVLALLQSDPSPRVREHAAIAAGLLRVAGGETALLTVCHRTEPAAVRGAAALAIGAFEQESIVARVVEMSDEAAVRAHLRERLSDDAWYRLLRRKLPAARQIELHALGADTVEKAGAVLARGTRRMLEPGDRIRLIGGLRALQGDTSREALLHLVRSDPSPEVRAAGMTAVAGLLDADELLAVAQHALGDPNLLVRGTAVGLYAKIAPERGLRSLLRSLGPDDDPAVLISVAKLAESAFPAFAELTLELPPDGQEALLAARVARFIHHAELPRLLPPMARSGSPAVREAIAMLWRQRPQAVDGAALEALTLDPARGVRRQAAGAAAAADRWDLIARMAEDPDPDVRRELALVLGGMDHPAAIALETLTRLADDQEMPVRAAAYIGRLLQGMPVPLPPGLDPRATAGALQTAAHLPALRETARTAPAEDRRLAAALALALVEDDVARQVARTDPAPAIRHRVSGALELAAAARAGG